MYVRVLHFICREETQKAQIQQEYQRMIEQVNTVEGFIGATLLMHENTCAGMALMYWQDEYAAGEAGPLIVDLLHEHAHELLENPPEMAGYHVIENGTLSDNR